MSSTGVPSSMSTSLMCSVSPSTRSRRTADSPSGFGRCGERVANTPLRPERLRGGSTFGRQPSLRSNQNSTQMYCHSARFASACSKLRPGKSSMRPGAPPLARGWRAASTFVAAARAHVADRLERQLPAAARRSCCGFRHAGNCAADSTRVRGTPRELPARGHLATGMALHAIVSVDNPGRGIMRTSFGLRAARRGARPGSRHGRSRSP